VAAKLSVVLPTVGKWRSRFAKSRLHGLSGVLRENGINRTVSGLPTGKFA
jgi:hypothetical protein